MRISPIIGKFIRQVVTQIVLRLAYRLFQRFHLFTLLIFHLSYYPYSFSFSDIVIPD